MKKVICIIISLLLLFSILVLPSAAAYVTAPIINPCDDTGVLEDLTAMGYDTYDYPSDPSGNFLQVIHFLEYAYSRTDSRYYSLYLYLYNPCGKEIAENGSTLQLCYTSGGKETKYLKYNLKVVSASAEKGSENTLYKLKVEGVRDICKNIDAAPRVYNLASVEILYKGESKPVTKTLKSSDGKNRCKWSYSGFQNGFGSKADEGTLRYQIDVLDTIPIELHDASWMSDTSSLGEDYRWEVKSYYFAIPESYIKKYGNPTIATDDTDGLVAVEGEYYKYGLNGLIVPTQEFYDMYLESVNTYIFPEVTDYKIKSFIQISHPDYVVDLYYYNFKPEFSFNFGSDAIYDFDWAYLVSFESQKHLFKYNLLSIGSTASIQSDVFKALWEASGKPVLTNPGHMVMGSNVSNIGDRIDFKVTVEDGDLAKSIKTYASKNEWGKLNWLHKLFNKDLYTDEDGYMDCKSLIQINAGDINDLQKEDYLGTDLYLDYESYQGLKTLYRSCSDKNGVFLMRLGVEPYYESDVYLCDVKDQELDKVDVLGEGNYYEKVIYKDTDVFAFTFKDRNGGLQRVPVECDPVDNLGSVVEGNNKDDNNPNGYPEDPSATDILDKGIKDLFAFLGSLKGIVVLIGSTIGITVISVLVIVFWKYLEPWFIRAGKVIGWAGRGLGKFFGAIGRGLGRFFGWIGRGLVFVLKILLFIPISIWNIGMTVLSIWFPPAAFFRVNMSFSSGGSSNSNDSRYYYEDRQYKQKEERRRQERHEAEMEALRNNSKSKAVSKADASDDEFVKIALENYEKQKKE